MDVRVTMRVISVHVTLCMYVCLSVCLSLCVCQALFLRVLPSVFWLYVLKQGATGSLHSCRQ